jgi:methyltransferase (TIGR00027 family)
MTNATAIRDVSDTALWVATYRAMESDRPDALFRDPLAARLAGERGKQIAAAMPYPKIMNWILVIRTVALDRLILNAIELGADTVVNLGTGLDTRPYRMTLPPALRWIEVDFPNIIEYKNQTLASEKPACRLERIALDLSNFPERRALFQRIGAESKKTSGGTGAAVVITEGVIPYISSADAAALSEDLYAIPSFQYWIQDYRQGGFRQWTPRRMKEIFKDAPFKFNETDWLSFFKKQGWKIGENILAWDESRRLRRPFPFLFPWSLIGLLLPPKMRKRVREASGFVMYVK